MVQPALSSVTEESLSAIIAMEEKGGGGNEHLQGYNNIATYILMVLDKLGPGHLGRSQLGPRQLGPRQLGPGAHCPP